MATRKRNEWLEPAEEEENEAHSDSESETGFSRARRAARSSKRRRVDIDDDLFEKEVSDEDAFDKTKAANVSLSQAEDTNSDGPPGARNKLEEEEDEDEDDDADLRPVATLKTSRSHAVAEGLLLEGLDLPKASSRPKAKRKSGVVYLSRIPPFMKPQTLRSYLAPYGEIGKIFLTPEDHATYIRRKRSGGNKKHSFIDGWVEFLSKKDAKMVASTLNGNIMGGKKGNYYHDDMWNIKYLHGFKWDDLTEQIARENKEREARLRSEITKAKRENEAFVRDIEKGKMLDTMRTKEAGRMQRAGGNTAETGLATGKSDSANPTKYFKQNAARHRDTAAKRDDSAQQQAYAILSKVL